MSNRDRDTFLTLTVANPLSLQAATMTDVSDAHVERLAAMVEQLQAEVAQLKARNHHPGPTNAVPADEPVDRRRMLKGAGLAAAAGAAALVVTGRPEPAGAIVPTLSLDAVNNVEAPTTMKYDGVSRGARVLLLATDTSLTASQSGVNCAIAGWAQGTTCDVGVYGWASNPAGVGVAGIAVASSGTGVWGQGNNGATALYGQGLTNSRGLEATSDENQAMWAHIDNAANASTTVRAETAESGSGVFAISAKGAGGKFQGKTAQIQLVPSTSTTHPASGSAGQLFVDASNRLWFCKGGTNWHQLA